MKIFDYHTLYLYICIHVFLFGGLFPILATLLLRALLYLHTGQEELGKERVILMIILS